MERRESAVIKRLLFDNAGWKLLSLAIAILLWMGFIQGPQLVTSVSVPVAYRNMPPDLEMDRNAPEQVLLELRGPAVKLRAFDASRASVVLNLSTVHGPGEQTFTIEPENIQLPNAVSLVRAIPSEMRLNFEEQAKAQIPIRIQWATPPPAGYRIQNQFVSPSSLAIVGPASHVRQVTYAETDPIDVSHVVGRTEFHVHTFVADPQVRCLFSKPVAVIVTLEKTAQGGTVLHGEAAIRN